eukprot:jgi/Chlat1/2086/Chrsp17S02686
MSFNRFATDLRQKARKLVWQNKRRHQESGFDLDLTYITENIIAMGYPASRSGLFSRFEGLYHNDMSHVLQFLETHHKDCFKVYNLCSERAYDADSFDGLVAAFPVEDNQCAPLQLLVAFCESAKAWLRRGMNNVVIVHCGSGVHRTGLAICCLLLYLRFANTADAAVAHFSRKRVADGKGVTLPSHRRYIAYFEEWLKGPRPSPPPTQLKLRHVRLRDGPPWLRPIVTVSSHAGTLWHAKNTSIVPGFASSLWRQGATEKVSSPTAKGGMRDLKVYELVPRITAILAGDFKVTFQDEFGEFSCWLNTGHVSHSVMLKGGELDFFGRRLQAGREFAIELVFKDATTPDSTRASQDENALQDRPRQAQSAVETSAQGSPRTSVAPVATKAAGSASGTQSEEDAIFSDDNETPRASTEQEKQGTLSNETAEGISETAATSPLPMSDVQSEPVKATAQPPDTQPSAANGQFAGADPGVFALDSDEDD